MMSDSENTSQEIMEENSGPLGSIVHKTLFVGQMYLDENRTLCV